MGDQDTDLLQLTNFRRIDTRDGGVDVDSQHVYFSASADPRGTNSSENCQIFSIDRLGTDLRQLTTSMKAARQVGCRFDLRRRRLRGRWLTSGSTDSEPDLLLQLRSAGHESPRRPSFRHAPGRQRFPPAHRHPRRGNATRWHAPRRAARPLELRSVINSTGTRHAGSPELPRGERQVFASRRGHALPLLR